MRIGKVILIMAVIAMIGIGIEPAAGFYQGFGYYTIYPENPQILFGYNFLNGWAAAINVYTNRVVDAWYYGPTPASGSLDW